jgi:hypothetical protein
MNSFFSDRSCTNIAKRIISGLKVLFMLKNMVSRTHISLVSFALGTVVKLTKFTAPRDSCLTLLYTLVAVDADSGTGR